MAGIFSLEKNIMRTTTRPQLITTEELMKPGAELTVVTFPQNLEQPSFLY